MKMIYGHGDFYNRLGLDPEKSLRPSAVYNFLDLLVDLRKYGQFEWDKYSSVVVKQFKFATTIDPDPENIWHWTRWTVQITKIERKEKRLWILSDRVVVYSLKIAYFFGLKVDPEDIGEWEFSLNDPQVWGLLSNLYHNA